MRFENKTFTTDVTLDFNEFRNCTFDGCTIYYHGNPFWLVNPTLKNTKFCSEIMRALPCSSCA